MTSSGLPTFRILLVDDNNDLADAFAKLLQVLGQEVRVAYGGPDALEVAPTFDPDLAFIDIAMPGMDGCETAKKLKQLKEFRATLVALTGYGQDDIKRRAKEAGFDMHVVKPISVADLERILKEKAAAK